MLDDAEGEDERGISATEDLSRVEQCLGDCGGTWSRSGVSTRSNVVVQPARGDTDVLDQLWLQQEASVALERPSFLVRIHQPDHQTLLGGRKLSRLRNTETVFRGVPRRPVAWLTRKKGAAGAGAGAGGGQRRADDQAGAARGTGDPGRRGRPDADDQERD